MSLLFITVQLEPEPVKNGPAPQQQDDGKMYVYWYTSVQTVDIEEPCHGNHFRRSVPVQSAGKLQFQADSELLLSRRTSAELELLLPPITSAKPENRVAKSILAVPEIPTSVTTTAAFLALPGFGTTTA